MAKINYDRRRACHPEDVKHYDTTRLRKEFLVQNLFVKDEIRLSYSQYERYILGGVFPVGDELTLEPIDAIKSAFFCERREVGVINIAGEGIVYVDGNEYQVKNKEALYIGRGSKEVKFKSVDKNNPAKFYFSSTPAHAAYPTTLVNKTKANILNLGSLETSNERTIYQLIIPGIVQSCQLVMGLTELHKGSVWNTMPAHTHDRRMEAYFYFDLPENQTILHLMGEPQETRHLFIHNEEAVFSPEWGIHSAAGTSNYSFIWGMGGENLDYTDMDHIKPYELR
ncbi:MAG TPA: 5-dehydro-4-deoxy-D-glucuronate isomerase [Marinilabiliales bacterium]|jgi:4-deoxy-L-threo-5-hexosulose-uronate ketol-isomerase|nr:MAG: 5-dehydro-4-deoxy-D-glucuronate isomerase [Bacteroidetes bacterium GWA2_40_14]OFX56760.1 MAG: 5-dehydro-4-deoxy-D-glucuronate isomerase [Bacteroidetes bacterium GWC2_40_13]OFX72857.1 MAG: 5-dehydro-4-deoxy-D-glucuronate isomerase [Bacteroidetes bacterium GWD2_40_43]OFX93550.1 MAG: 5-dehydro-4-deoxy-D-glucuronate isomerase [Bacteroidetes bacterium GWE2_40_63]OFY18300.1 MAG: 5-dehydro-4-deoxy-D-glucuronate isomerase [Bacteroidetes bacterium GWF2_40_13]OFZ27519.1 MAG: 5-dehydro-4-deoxy-D-